MYALWGAEAKTNFAFLRGISRIGSPQANKAERHDCRDFAQALVGCHAFG